MAKVEVIKETPPPILVTTKIMVEFTPDEYALMYVGVQELLEKVESKCFMSAARPILYILRDTLMATAKSLGYTDGPSHGIKARFGLWR